MVDDTKPTIKTCSKCDTKKESDKFIKKRNICKQCANTRRKQLYDESVNSTDIERVCKTCNQTKPVADFIKNRVLCKECNNANRRTKYENDENHRIKLIQQATLFKHNKILEKREIKEATIGKDNKKCSKCSTIKLKDRFRHNRLYQ